MKTENLSFMEACLMHGSYDLTRKDKSCFIWKKETQNLSWTAKNAPTQICMYQEDIEATDWCIVQEKKTLSDQIFREASGNDGFFEKLLVEDVKDAVAEILLLPINQVYKDYIKAIVGERLI